MTRLMRMVCFAIIVLGTLAVVCFVAHVIVYEIAQEECYGKGR